MSLFRRAKAQLLKIIGSDADPAIDPDAVQLYAKSVDGVLNAFAETSDGKVHQLTPVLAPAMLAKNALYFREDFFGSFSVTVVSLGGFTSYTVPGGEPGAPGILRTNLTNVGDRVAVLPITVSTVVTGIAPGGGELTWEVRARTPVAQDGVDQWSVRLGMGDDAGSADYHDGIYFEADRATYGDNDVRLCTAIGDVRTKQSLGVAMAVNTWERWKFVVSAPGDSVQAYLNDVAVGPPVTTNIPVSSAAYCCQFVKTAGANLRNIDVDYVELFQLFTNQR